MNHERTICIDRYRSVFPTYFPPSLSFYDHNIISNHPLSVHHFDKPSARPFPDQKTPAPKSIPAFLVKDFNPLTNRYLNSHAEKSKRDHELSLLEATAKHRTRNRFHPLTQEYLDPEEERRMKVVNEAHEVEQIHRALAQVRTTNEGPDSNVSESISPFMNSVSFFHRYRPSSRSVRPQSFFTIISHSFSL